METLPEHIESLGVAVALFPGCVLHGVNVEAKAISFLAGDSALQFMPEVILAFPGWRLELFSLREDGAAIWRLYSAGAFETAPYLAQALALKGTELRDMHCLAEAIPASVWVM